MVKIELVRSHNAFAIVKTVTKTGFLGHKDTNKYWYYFRMEDWRHESGCITGAEEGLWSDETQAREVYSRLSPAVIASTNLQ